MAQQNGKIEFTGIGKIQNCDDDSQALVNELAEKLGGYLQRADAQGLETFGSKVVQRVRAASQMMLELLEKVQKQKAQHEKNITN